MNNIYQLRIWPVITWVLPLAFWGGPLWVFFFSYTHFHSIIQHPIAIIQIIVYLTMLMLTPYFFSNLIVEIRREGSELILKSFGRHRLLPFGPISKEHRVSADSSFEWRRPRLVVNVPGTESGYSFTLATRINKKQLGLWFEHNGMTKPIGC